MPLNTPNALPLSRTQARALITATARELGWGLRAVSREVARWRAHAAAIPDSDLRHAALHALDAKRGHIDGAAMFWTLPRRRNPVLLRTLVAYELLQDFLDGVSEDGGALGPQRGASLYAALGDALDVVRAPSEYFAVLPECDDGGYISALVEACRTGCRTLPSYEAVRPLLLQEVDRAEVLLLNHEPQAAVRQAALRRWAAEHFGDAADLPWHESTAAASGWITTHALLAVAAWPSATPAEAATVHAAYFPWLALTLTLLDGYADLFDDAATGSHSYLSYYADEAVAAARLAGCIHEAASAVRAVPDGERHAVLLACMIALYLSKDSARTRERRATTAAIASAGGTLTQLLLPVLRAWRLCNGQRRAT